MLKPGGQLLMVDPGPDHLRELRQIIYPTLKPERKTVPAVPAEFSPQPAETVRFSFALDGAEPIADLLAMTPRLPPARGARPGNGAERAQAHRRRTPGALRAQRHAARGAVEFAMNSQSLPARTAMHVTLVHIRVKPESVAAFIDATRANCEAAAEQAGQPPFRPAAIARRRDAFHSLRGLRTAADAAAHKDTAHYLVWRETVGAMMAGAPGQAMNAIFAN